MRITNTRRQFTGFAAFFAAFIFAVVGLNEWSAQAAQDQSFIQMPVLERQTPPAETSDSVESDQVKKTVKLNMMMGVCTVDRLTDNAPAGSGEGAGANGDLRYCMAKANMAGGSNTIEFSVTGIINLAGELPLINNDLTIHGPGANLMTVRRNTGGDYRIFTINLNRVVTINGLTITKGRVLPNGFTGGGGLLVNSGATLNLSDSVVTDNEGYSFGGGILSFGALNINHCTISFNKAGNGGGFYILFTTATINNSTINNNTTDFQAGVGIQDATVAMTNCTITNNSATTGGGGVVSRATTTSAAATLTNCTVANNSGPGAALWVIKFAGAAGASLTAKNTLAASNSPVNFINGGGTLTLQSHNLDTDGSSGAVNGVNGNIVGSAGSPIDAKLGPLANNGGATQTRALLCGSPAADAGDNNGAPATDQRGVARPYKGIVDIGAYEANMLCLGALPNGKVGVPYNEFISVNGPAPYVFSLVQGSLPTGLVLNSATGQISGVVTVVGTYNFTIQVTDAQGLTGTQNYSLSFGCPTIVFTPASLPGGATGVAYTQTVSATPAGGLYNFALAGGTLPTGLALNAATGAIAGVPSQPGTYSFLVQATGFSVCPAVMSYSIIIGGNQCPMITLPEITNGQVGQMYNNSVMASPADAYNYAVTAGNLPPGITLYGQAGLLFGFAAAPGTYNFTITATGANNCSASKNYSVTITM